MAGRDVSGENRQHGFCWPKKAGGKERHVYSMHDFGESRAFLDLIMLQEGLSYKVRWTPKHNCSNDYMPTPGDARANALSI